MIWAFESFDPLRGVWGARPPSHARGWRRRRAMRARVGRLGVPLIGLVLVGAVAGSARPAGSHAGNTDPAVIHACVNTKKGDVRIVGVAGTCASGEQALHWRPLLTLDE